MAYALEALTSCDDEFFDVIKMCKLPYREDSAVPLIIEKIVNPKLEEAFNKRIAAIKDKSGVTPNVRWPMYHGTNKDAANKIAANGFDVSKARVCAYNNGIYFAQNYEYSTDGHYAKQDDYGHQFLFVCKVIEGRTCLGKDSGKTDTSKYDCARNHDGTILSTPYSDGALPVYFVRYYKHIPRSR